MSESVLTTMELIEGYRFKVKFDLESVPSIFVDEPKPIGEGSAPSPTMLLSTAVGHCLSSSLLYCLGKAKVNAKKLDTTVAANVERNKEGYLRITGIHVQIRLEVAEADKPRVQRCLNIFENYCTVTQSVRQGIGVNVNAEFL